MSRALLCSVALLSLAAPGCGSSSSGGSGNTAGSNQSQAGSNSSSGGSSSATGGSTSNNGGSNPTGGSGTSTAGSGSGTAGSGNGTGGSGTGGSSAGGTGPGTGGSGPSTAGPSVTQWGGDLAHTSHWVHASLTKANAAKLTLDTFTAPGGTTEYAGNFRAKYPPFHCTWRVPAAVRACTSWSRRRMTSTRSQKVRVRWLGSTTSVPISVPEPAHVARPKITASSAPR